MQTHHTPIDPVRVVLIDDHPMFLEGLSNLLTAHGMQVVGFGNNGLEAQYLARTLRPDLIVMDLYMPICDGIEATRRITAEWPEARIIILTASADEEQLFAAFHAGAVGYLLKNLHADEFFHLLSGLDEGVPPIAPELAQKIDPELVSMSKEDFALTPLQHQILQLVGQGLTYREVATHVHMSESSIKYHMKQILSKLDLDSRTQVIAYAHRMGGV